MSKDVRLRYLQELRQILRGVIDTRCMSNTTPAESSAVPERIQEAERWRVAGARLRALAPNIYEQISTMLVMSIPCDSDNSDDSITETIFRT